MSNDDLHEAHRSWETLLDSLETFRGNPMADQARERLLAGDLNGAVEMIEGFRFNLKDPKEN